MAITSISRDWGSEPSIVRITTTDNFATITANGYLLTQISIINLLNNGIFEWLNGDIIAIDYASGQGFFTRDAVNETFVTETTTVVLPVVSGNLASFSGTGGDLGDSGIASAAVVTQTGASVINHIPMYSNIIGDITDSTILNTSLVLKAETAQVGSFLQYDSDGNVVNAGFSAVRGETVSTTIAGTTATLGISGLTTSHQLQCTLKSAQDTVSMQATPIADQINFSFSGPPGTGTVISVWATLTLP